MASVPPVDNGCQMQLDGEGEFEIKRCDSQRDLRWSKLQQGLGSKEDEPLPPPETHRTGNSHGIFQLLEKDKLVVL